MALIALDVNATKEFSLAGDDGADRTVFVLGLLDVPLRAKVDDDSMAFSVNRGEGESGPSTIHLNRNARAVDVVRFGLRGWRGLRGADGNEVPFARTQVQVDGVGMRMGVTDDCMSRLQIEWVRELADAITDMNKIGAEDKKK